MTQLFIILAILPSFLANLEQKTLQSDFNVSVAENATQPLNYPGTITMHGRQFTLSMFGLEAAYDGQTLYLYNGDTDELTLSTPTEQELLQANPFIYAKAMLGLCDVAEQASANGEETVITLTPKEAQQLPTGQVVNKFVLKVRNADLVPLSLDIREGKRMTTLQLNSPHFVSSDPKYVLEPEPSTYVNDMRF